MNSDDYLELRNKIKNITLKSLGIEEDNAIINDDTELLTLGLNSINYVKIVVHIEREINIEFDDNALDIGNFLKFKDIVDYVYKKVKGNI